MPGQDDRVLWTDRVFETLVENAPDIIARFGRDLRPIYVNAAIERLTGIPAAHFIGRTFEEAGFPPAAAAEWNELAERAFTTGEQIDTEFFHTIGGSVRWFRSRVVPEIGDDGSFQTIIVVCRDITELKVAMEERIDREKREAVAVHRDELRRTEDTLRLSDLRLRRLFDGNLIGVVTADNERIFEANDAFLRMVERDREELVNGTLDWRAITPPEYLPLDEAALRELMASGTCTPFQKEYIRKSGERVPVLLGASIISTDPLEWVCFVLDLSELKRTEAERNALLENEKLLRIAAEESSRAKDALLASVSHELRNPLTSLMGWLHILEGGADADLTALALRSMHHSLAMQKHMVDDLIDTVRFSRGTVALAIDDVDVTELIDEIVDTSRPVAAASGIHLRAGHVEDVVIRADRSRLAQVVANLLSNALKFTPEGGVVTVAAWMDGTDLLIEVTDTGCGITAHMLPRVFDQFVQGGVHTRQGLGLGLAIVKEIVERHGGTVSVSSAGPGSGACFTVRMPAAGPADSSSDLPPQHRDAEPIR